MRQNCGDTHGRHDRERNPGKADAGAGPKDRRKGTPRDDRRKVGKSEGRVSRKAAIVRIVPVPQTDTGG